MRTKAIGGNVEAAHLARTKAIGGNVEAAHLAGVCSVVGGWKRGKWSVQEVRRLKRNVKAFMKVSPPSPTCSGYFNGAVCCVCRSTT